MSSRAICLFAAAEAAFAVACSQRGTPVTVGVVFQNSWTLMAGVVNESDRASIERRTFETLREAYAGFDLRFVEGTGATRTIRIEDTPYAPDARQRVTFGAAGVTYPASMVSSVRADVLFNAELAAARCSDMARCTKTRLELLEGFGRGLGATAAHELGHQAGFGFATDAPCDDCYDGRSSTSYQHFFGNKHWSDRALGAMRRVLPPA